MFTQYEHYEIKNEDNVGIGYQVEKGGNGNFVFITPVNEVDKSEGGE